MTAGETERRGERQRDRRTPALTAGERERERQRIPALTADPLRTPSLGITGYRSSSDTFPRNHRLQKTMLQKLKDLFTSVCSYLLYKTLGIQIRRTKCVGIFSREGESNYKFLQDFLTSSRSVVRDVRPFLITNNGQQQFREEARRCDVAILYHSKRRGRVNITNVTDCLYSEELDYLHRMLGKHNVIAVADDLDRSSAEEKQRILHEQPQIQQMARDLFLFSEENKREEDSHMNKTLHDILYIINHAFFLHIDSRKEKESPILQRTGGDDVMHWRRPSASKRGPRHVGEMGYKKTMLQKLRDFITSVCSYLLYKTLGIQIRRTKCVGIFSRDGESNYKFLQDFLTSSCNIVRDVRTFVITNDGQQQFREEARRCDVAILYHSKRRGRVNITDVTDCLYSEELDYLHRMLGKRNVIVVADDMERSSAEEKQRILHEQPQIQQMARDLFLFNEENKREEDSHMNKTLHDILYIINHAFFLHIESHKQDEIPILTPLAVRILQHIAHVTEHTVRPIAERLQILQ
ncbi:uncharacterized protein LOC134945649 isoform X2 [Pseudophryne corroboree]|uniref:uncharacterized protein LOC134945649 isoform X2 n=1 Tax=Pseudophryne corroboree TaxID=495146 RepID=UPI0030820ED9